LPVERLHRPGGEFDILFKEGVLDVLDGELPRGEGFAVEPDAHCIARGPADANEGDPRQDREPVDEIAVCVVGQLKRGHAFAGEIEPHHDFGGGILLRDLGRVGFFRQDREKTRDRLTQVVRGAVDVARDEELDRDGGDLVHTGGGNALNRFDRADAVLDKLGDAPFDYSGGGTGIGRLDRDDGRLDVGVFSDLQAKVRDHPESDEEQAHDKSEDGTPDGDVGKNHGPWAGVDLFHRGGRGRVKGSRGRSVFSGHLYGGTVPQREDSIDDDGVSGGEA